LHPSKNNPAITSQSECQRFRMVVSEELRMA
jgi:hypothetical protein